MLGVADKQPTTDGGRTIVLGMLFLTLLMQTVYTGSLNAKLMTAPMVTQLSSKSDFVFENSSHYSKNYKLCLPSTSTWKYHDSFMAPVADNPIETINGTDVKDCMWKVYLDEADATFYDEPVVMWRIANTFQQKGHCGSDGGYCYDNENKTVLKDVAWNQCTEDKWKVKSPGTPGTLVSVGQIFYAFGYAFAFPKKIDAAGTPSSDYMAFSQLINYVKERGDVEKIEDKRKTSPRVKTVRVAADGDGVLTLEMHVRLRAQTLQSQPAVLPWLLRSSSRLRT
jgi:hypothetical protein